MRNDEERQTHDIAAAWIAYGLFLLLVVAVSAALSLSERSTSRAEPTVRETTQHAPQSAATNARAPHEATWPADPPRALD